MKKITDFILKKRLYVIVLFLILAVFAGIETSQTKINPDVSSYLSSDTMSRQTIDELQDKFSINGDVLIGLGDQDLSPSSLNDVTLALQEVSTLTNVTNVDWIGNDLNRMLFLQYNESMTGVIDLLTIPQNQWNISPEKSLFLSQTIARYYHLDSEGHGCFLVYLSLGSSNTSDITFSTIDTLETILKSHFTDYYIGGTASTGKSMIDSALSDLPKFLTVAVIMILLILLICTKSYFEPFLFLFTIGIAIVLNLGTNFFIGSISTVTFSAAAILQLALAMDYSIFLMHSYYNERKTISNKVEAMKNALAKTNRSIAASALTTVGGFVALFAMKFKLGFDLGFVLAKGVFLSLVVVMFFQPCLILVFDKLFIKTSHRYVNLPFKGLTKGIKKTRIFGILIALVLFIPAIYFQNKVDYYYLDSRINEHATGAEEVVNNVGSQIVIIVNEADNVIKQSQLMTQLYALNDGNGSEITSILGYYPILQQVNTVVDVTHPAYAQIQTMNLPSILAQKFIHDNQTYYIIQINGASESSSTIELTKSINQILDANFSLHYTGGSSQIVIDFNQTTKNDFLLISIISALIILFILILTYKSIVTPLILLVVIELGIFINLSITYFIGQPINFMSYLIISAIQLGATIDYAILLTSRYRERYDIKEAITRSSMSIVVSIAILVTSCMSVYFIASDPIIKEITFLIARGSLISGIIVLFILPRILVFFKKKTVSIQ